MNQSCKTRPHSSVSLFQEIFPKLRPFQKEAVEFATKGTSCRNYQKPHEDNEVVTEDTKKGTFPDTSPLGNGRILLADEMGLGKTVTALAIASYYYEQDPHEWPLLILCPASLRYTWPLEMEKFWPSLPPSAVHVVTGFSDVSWMNRISSGHVKIVVASYSLWQNRSAVAQCLVQQIQDRNKQMNQKPRPLNATKSPQPQLKDNDQKRDGGVTGVGVYFPTIIVDESHNLKQRDSQRTKMILPLLQASKRLILLSGTPALNRPVELHTQLNALEPNLFGEFHDFASRYCSPKKIWTVFNGGRRFPKWDYSGASLLDELHAKLKTVMVRRLKQDVLEELPPKQRSIIPVTISSDQSTACREAMKAVRDSHEARDPNEHSFETKNQLTQAYHATGLGKASAVTEYLLDWLDGSSATDKIVVFAHHTKVLDHIQAELHRKAIHGSNRSQSSCYHIRIDGQVPSHERHKLVRQFQTQAQTRVALLSMTAAGVGLTLTAASTVLFAELHWTPGVLVQAEDRVHRLGQTKVSQIVYCLCQDEKGSLDQILCGMLGRKMNTLLQVVDGGGGSEKGQNRNFLANVGQHQGVGRNETDVGRSGQEEVTDFFANLNQTAHRSHAKRPVVRGSIESYFSKSFSVVVPSETPPDNDRTKLKRPPSLAKVPLVTVCPHEVECLEDGTPPFPETTFDTRPNQPTTTPCKSTSVSSVSMVHWRCSACTFDNCKPSTLEDVYYCEMCDQSHSRWDNSKEPNAVVVSGTSSSSSSLVTPTNGTKKAKRKVGTTPVIELDSDDNSIASSQSSSVIEILDMGTTPSKKKHPYDSRILEKPFSWLFGVSKNSGRITIHRKEPESSTHVNFDVHQVLTKESAEDLDLRQTRGVHRTYSPLKFSDKGLEEIVLSVQKTMGLDIESAQLVLDIRAFVTSFVQLRAVEQQAIKTSEIPFPPVRLSQAVAAILARRCMESAQSTGLERSTSNERYSGGLKERACEKRENGVKLTPEELDVLEGKACSWCGQKLSRGHKKAHASYCTQECAEEGRLRRGGRFASKQIRAAVFALEGGKCTLCGIDAHTLYDQIRSLQPAERLNRLLNANWKLPRTGKGVESFLRNPKEGDFWQVDHIQAVAEGGGSCGLENLRTLCVPCHQKETEKLRSRIKLSGSTPKQVTSTTTKADDTGSANINSTGKKRKQIDIRSAFFSESKAKKWRD